MIAEETTYCGKCHEGDRGSIMLRGELLVYLILCDCSKLISNKGPFTNYVYKRRGVGGQKNLLFVNFYTIENVNGGG